MSKKLLATILASTMVLGSVSAYAADPVAPSVSGGSVTLTGDVTKGQKIDVVSETHPVLIEVEVPTQIDILFNPFDIGGVGQVLSPVYTITNKSDVAMNATLTKWDVTTSTPATGELPITMATAPIKEGGVTTKKEAFLMLTSGTDGGVPSALDMKVAIPTSEKGKVVPAKTGVANVSYGSLLDNTGGAKSALQLQFQGNLSSKILWSKTDSINAAPTFKFEPTIVTTK